MKWWMLVNSRGRPDALLTFAAGAVAVVLLKTLLSGVVVAGVTFGTMDAGLAGLILGTTLVAYTGKRIVVDKAAAPIPLTTSVAAPPEILTRGYVLPGTVILVALGFWLYLYAMAHRGIR